MVLLSFFADSPPILKLSSIIILYSLWFLISTTSIWFVRVWNANEVLRSILVTGRYPEGEKYGGTDRLSYGTISKFRDFINQEVSNYRHIIVEGDRFFRAPDVEWVLDNHDAKVYILTVDAEEEARRHKERNDNQNLTWLQGRRSVISNILTNFFLMSRIEVRSNQTLEDSENIKQEIIELLT